MLYTEQKELDQTSTDYLDIPLIKDKGGNALLTILGYKKSTGDKKGMSKASAKREQEQEELDIDHSSNKKQELQPLILPLCRILRP